MTTVRVGNERESTSGWRFEVFLLPAADAQAAGSRHEVTLSWIDYEHWSHGVYPPARVVEAIMRFLAERAGAEAIRASFDLGRVRRRFPDVDEVLPRLL